MVRWKSESYWIVFSRCLVLRLPIFEMIQFNLGVFVMILKVIFISTIAALIGFPSISAMAQEITPLQLYWSGQRSDNFVTADPKGGNDALGAGYRYVRDEACVLSAQQQGSVPLNLYWNAGRGDNFTTATNQGVRSARAAGYRFVRVEGYVFKRQQPDTVPLNLYWSAKREDNFTTATNQGVRAARAAGYVFVRVEGYAYPASRCR